MKKLIGIVALASLTSVALVGCEDKKPAATKAADATKGMMDKGKEAAAGAVEKAKETAAGAVESAKEKVAEGATALRDKAVEAMKPQIDAAKAKLDEMMKKVDGLDAIKKAAASPLAETAKKAFADLTGKFDAFKGSTDGWEKSKEGVEGSLKTFNDAAGKLGEMLK